jgi:hypothetical protein
MLTALGTSLRDLNSEVRGNPECRKRLSLAFILEAQNPDIEVDRLFSIVYGENQMVKLYSHCITHFEN